MKIVATFQPSQIYDYVLGTNRTLLFSRIALKYFCVVHAVVSLSWKATICFQLTDNHCPELLDVEAVDHLLVEDGHDAFV